ncbi:hypothetical protein NSB04_23460, partial [Blautia pseudococcoides]|nr:hypothetical protein [Blautia pseudococcoides]
PSDEFFKNPVYNSWIELTFWQNEEAILKYADSILDNGMSAGVLMRKVPPCQRDAENPSQ